MNKMAKKIIVLLFSFCVLTQSQLIIKADAMSQYSQSTNISGTKNSMSISGYIPTIKNLTNPMFQYKLNAAIKAAYEQRVQAALQNKTRTLNFSYEIIQSGEYLSILLFSENKTSKTSEIDSFVISTKYNAYASINTVLGGNGIAFVNKYVSNKIKTDSSVKYFNFSEITMSTPFYVKNGNIVILYGSGKICAVSKGVVRFEVPTKNLKNIKIPVLNYYVKSPYNVKMIPLRTVLQSFGYSLEWSSSKNQIIISKSGVKISTLTIGSNIYPKEKFNPKRLEFAPEIRNGTTYVPISFFEEILNLLFSTDATNAVTISQYTL